MVLFDQFHDFQTFARKVRPGLENSAGFWDTRYNVTVFSKYGTQGHLKELLEAARRTKKQVAENTGERTRLRRILRALNVAIATVEEKASVEVVFHEMPCFGCNWECIYSLKNNEAAPCIASISVDAVWKKIKPLLN